MKENAWSEEENQKKKGGVGEAIKASHLLDKILC